MAEKNQFELPESVSSLCSIDERPGYTGYIVSANNLIAFAKSLRDELFFDYLSSITAVDYFPEDRIEVVYHAYRSFGGQGLVFKVATTRTPCEIPSLMEIYTGAELQEREAWDLMGVKFLGHPDLRRILMWEGFSGHPLRKDWKEPFFEEEFKPFKSRSPEGRVHRAEDNNPFNGNVQYPADFDPTQWKYQGESLIYDAMKKADITPYSGIKTDRIILNLGPQHPSTHGVFRMIALLDGETVIDLKPMMGYLHRNHEKIGERNTYNQIMPYTDRLDYVASMSNNFGYAITVEKMMGIKPPERAEYIRVIMAELTRIASHLIAIGFLLNDLGAYFTPSLYGLEERELILDIFEAVSGSRMMCNYFRFGGVARDLPDGILERIKHIIVDRLPRKLDDFHTYITQNEIVQIRCKNVGVISPEKAIANSNSGPILRATGIPYDLRRADPYSIYDRFDFDVVVHNHGDVFDRYLVRIEEIEQSMRIIKQAIEGIPEGPIFSGKPQYQVRVPAGEAYGRVEGPKGELGYYLVSNGKSNPWRFHVRAPSFINLTSLREMCIGTKVADVVVILGSIDIVLGEVDR